MHGYFDESGSPALVRDGVFITMGVWTTDAHSIERFMRKWLRVLHSEGYPFPEIKGSELTTRQRGSGIRNISKKLGSKIELDLRVLMMDFLIQDHRLHYPREWTETEVHQAILYEMIMEHMETHNGPSARIAIDGRHTLPKSFFHGMERIVRTRFSSNTISIFRSSSNLQKGIQLSDVLCNSCYRAVRSALTASVQVEEQLIQKEIQTPATIRVMNATELLNCLSHFQAIGGPL